MPDPPYDQPADETPPAARRSFAIRRGEGAHQFQVPYQQELNEEQRAAVFADEQHVLVLAGAGSGKTRVITYRLAYLLEQGARLDTCMLATFTNRAAREMLHRVETLLQRPMEGLWGGTFHSLCARLLRREAPQIGFGDRFTILDSEDASELMAGVRAELVQNVTERRFPQSQVLCTIHSFSQNMGRPAHEVLAEKFPQFAEVADQVGVILQAYQKRKRALNAMDYDDLLAHAVTVLTERPEVRKKWGLHFRHILVDEYQDTNHAQGVIVDALASEGANIMVVGDDAQAIFAFRGADYRNILTFHERYPDLKTYKLETNYRSMPPVLKLANALFSEAPEHFKKTLVPVKRGGFKPALVACRDSTEEAQFIASRILDLREEGIELSGMAVLYRSHASALSLEMELRSRRIPFIVRGGLRFLEQAHIKDVLAHLIVTVNGRDAISWQRILKLQKKVGPKRALELWADLEPSPDPFGEFIKGSGGDWGTLPALRKLLAAIAKLPPEEAIAQVSESHYREVVWSKYTDPRQRIEDLEQLATFAAKFDDVTMFLQEIALIGGLSAEEIVSTDDPDEKVTLSTIHQAKGLEWPVVFVPVLVEGMVPHWMALKEGGREEERRLLYVAITRAQEELYLSYPQVQMRRGGPILTQLSSFLTELPDGLMDEAVIESAKPPTPEALAGPKPGDVAVEGPSAVSPFEE